MKLHLCQHFWTARLVPMCRGSLFDVLKEAKSSPALAKKLTWQRRLRMVGGQLQGAARRLPLRV